MFLVLVGNLALVKVLLVMLLVLLQVILVKSDLIRRPVVAESGCF